MPSRKKNSRSRGSRRRSRSPSRGWRTRSPKSTNPRRTLYEKCGPTCFLDPKNLKYPICRSRGRGVRGCKPDCRGILAAYERSRQSNRSSSVARKARRLAKKSRCKWSR